MRLPDVASNAPASVSFPRQSALSSLHRSKIENEDEDDWEPEGSGILDCRPLNPLNPHSALRWDERHTCDNALDRLDGRPLRIDVVSNFLSAP